MGTALLRDVAIGTEPLFGAVGASAGIADTSGAPTRRAEKAQSYSSEVEQSSWDTSSFELTFELAVSLSVVSAFVIVFLIVGSVVVRRAGRRRPFRGGREDAKRRVDAAEIDRRFPGTTVDDEPTCAVCLLQVELDEVCRVTDCGHAFHADCILQWWTHKPRTVLRCPECRQKQRRNASLDTRMNGHAKRLRRQQLDFRERDDKDPPDQFQPCHRRVTPPKQVLLPVDPPLTGKYEEKEVATDEDDLEAEEEEDEGEEQGEREGDNDHNEGDDEREIQEEEEEGLPAPPARAFI